MKRVYSEIDRRYNNIIKKLDLEKWPRDPRFLNIALKQILKLHKPELVKMDNGRYTLKCNECPDNGISPCWTYSVIIEMLD